MWIVFHTFGVIPKFYSHLIRNQISKFRRHFPLQKFSFFGISTAWFSKQMIYSLALFASHFVPFVSKSLALFTYVTLKFAFLCPPLPLEQQIAAPQIKNNIPGVGLQDTLHNCSIMPKARSFKSRSCGNFFVKSIKLAIFFFSGVKMGN